VKSKGSISFDWISLLYVRDEIPFDRLRTGFASVEFILNEVKGSSSE